MQGRYPSGKLVVFSNCTDPTQEDLFNTRYNNHLPEFLETGWVVNGMRYKAPQNKPESQSSNYLAIYETERWDMEDMLEDIHSVHSPQWKQNNTDIPFMQGERANVFRRCGPPNRPDVGGFTTNRTGKAPVSGIIVMYGTFAQPSQENEYNIWYNRTFVPALLKISPFHTAYRYACTVREPDRSRLFLTIYETDAANPADVTKQFLDNWDLVTPQSPLVQELGYAVFAPIFELVPQVREP